MEGTSALQDAAVFASVNNMPGGAGAARPRVVLGVRSGAAAFEQYAHGAATAAQAAESASDHTWSLPTTSLHFAQITCGGGGGGAECLAG